ncbi:hypothetical protein H2200_000360 [Cladophialophora chaetospira]|uniref:Myb-like DNA-binding domain-containing protein n=1 Tax=Cladophialophora chaetospira TaxID=386627 RepID=A0AA38XP49_9EURO|nr:hypothetical protein H2200_000360 [Cladophialophora chaetospira]
MSGTWKTQDDARLLRFCLEQAAAKEIDFAKVAEVLGWSSVNSMRIKYSRIRKYIDEEDTRISEQDVELLALCFSYVSAKPDISDLANKLGMTQMLVRRRLLKLKQDATAKREDGALGTSTSREPESKTSVGALRNRGSKRKTSPEDLAKKEEPIPEHGGEEVAFVRGDLAADTKSQPGPSAAALPTPSFGIEENDVENEDVENEDVETEDVENEDVESVGDPDLPLPNITPSQRIGGGAGGRLGRLLSVLARPVIVGWRFFSSSYHQLRKDDDAEAQTARIEALQNSATGSFYCICAMKNSRLPPLAQHPASLIKSDADYFHMLRNIDKDRTRTWGLLLWQLVAPKKTSNLRYVMFELLQSKETVDIKRDQSIHPKDEKLYQPCEDDLSGGRCITTELLYHLFQTPHDCLQNEEIYRRIPRKLKGKLVPSGNDENCFGWGVELVETSDPEGELWVTIAIVAISLLFGLCWWLFQAHDIQGATGIVQTIGAILSIFLALHMARKRAGKDE